MLGTWLILLTSAVFAGIGGYLVARLPRPAVGGVFCFIGYAVGGHYSPMLLPRDVRESAWAFAAIVVSTAALSGVAWTLYALSKKREVSRG